MIGGKGGRDICLDPRVRASAQDANPETANEKVGESDLQEKAIWDVSATSSHTDHVATKKLWSSQVRMGHELFGILDLGERQTKTSKVTRTMNAHVSS